ncbi:MAG: HNH endonuclease, partial [Acidimicrobiales bacterium]|nr:HNH endonuclease [Acidimicrobiales bacterium]
LKAIVQRCQWPGCDRWARTSQADHLEPHADGGTSDPHNCGIHCPHHNKIKNDGYTTQRQPDGDIAYYRPDGTPIT